MVMTTDDMKGTETGCCEVPFTEQLRSVRVDFRASYAIQWSEDGFETGHHCVPVGYMMHKAADLLEQAQRELADMKQERDSAKREREDAKAEYAESRAEFERELEQVKKELAEVKQTTVHVTVFDAVKDELSQVKRERDDSRALAIEKSIERNRAIYERDRYRYALKGLRPLAFTKGGIWLAFIIDEALNHTPEGGGG